MVVLIMDLISMFKYHNTAASTYFHCSNKMLFVMFYENSIYIYNISLISLNIKPIHVSYNCYFLAFLNSNFFFFTYVYFL